MKHTNSIWSFFLLFSLFIIFPEVTSADEIILENGDRLSGTIKMVDEETLTLETDYSTPVKIHKAKIKRIYTNYPVEVHLSEGEVLKGRIHTQDDGRLVIEESPGRQAAVIDWQDITAVNPPHRVPSKWTGAINVGAGLQSGNTDRASAAIGAEAARRTEQDRYTLRFLHNYAEEDREVTARNTFGAGKYDYFFTRVLYGYLGFELLNDKFRDLNLRTVVGPGVGYQIWDDAVKFLLFETGISYFSEDLIEGDDDNWLTARLAGDLRYSIRDTVVFSDQLIIYPSLADVGVYQLRNEAAITSPLASGWSLRFANILERDSEPPEGIKSNDWYWILGLQYGF